MKKEKILLSVTATMVAITGAFLAINGGLKNSSVFATNEVVWHHYAAVAPTDTTHGSKEFWASSADGCATHTFTDPGVTCVERDFSTNDSFASLTWDDDRYVWSLNEQRDLGIIPVVTENTVTYGLYPQKNVNDSSLVSALNALTTTESNGWYLYDGEYYAKVSANPYSKDYQFDNGTTIVSGTTYWFKCEPITWNVLSDANGEYYILSSVLLDAHCYYDFSSADDESEEYRTNNGIYHNNYEYSDIRSWLNDEFYISAFALHNSFIQETTVDNSASTTDSDENPYACENTEDKVFLPSYQDYINSSYGFSAPNNPDDARRLCKTTDWARARGAWCDTRYYPYNGDYWTRSPCSGDYDVACSVAYIGWVDSAEWAVAQECVCVRPAISIKIA